VVPEQRHDIPKRGDRDQGQKFCQRHCSCPLCFPGQPVRARSHHLIA
jgi:hypothetical protein